MSPSTPSNRLGLDYRAEGARLGAPPVPIVDVHTHVNGREASRIFVEAMDAFGVARTWSQTQLAQAWGVREVLGDRVRFIAIPDYMAEDRRRAHTTGFMENIRRWHGEFGARMVKFWNAPRIVDYMDEESRHDLVGLDSPWRRKQADLAADLGMSFMTHVGDPDTWFKAKYTDEGLYGTKADQYAPLERMVSEYQVPWVAAHLGGWPEDLEFLSGLLSRHDNLHLDTSATKWIVREVSRHPREEVRAFLAKWRGRVLFGSDIVTHDEHLKPNDPEKQLFGANLADGAEAAFDLYASRYWALRMLWETDYDGESPIADPDLAMVDPGRFDEMSAPRLVGMGVAREDLEWLYAGAARTLGERIGVS
jgi:hypothetical protein